MKIASINNITANNAKNNRTQNNSRVNFKGVDVASGLVNLWKIIDNGGRGIQFVVEDMCSTNIERTSFGLYNDIKAFNRRKKLYKEAEQKGTLKPGQKEPKLSLAAFPSTIQEGVREFLTGPTMTAMPFLVLKASKKAMGKTSDTHLVNILSLSELMKQIPQESFKDDAWKNQFFEKAVRDMLSSTLNKQNDKQALDSQVKELVDGLKNYYDLTLQAKPNKKELAAKLNQLQDSFATIVKNNRANYKSSTFLNASFSLPFNQIGKTKFKQYAQYITSYVDDFSKKGIKDVTENVINNFRDSWFMKRLGTNVLMYGITALAMVNIPKWYTKLSGNINPNGIDVYEQANEKQNDKEVK